MKTPRFLLLCSMIMLVCASRAANAADPLDPFLHSLADSTDAYFGRSVMAFDTTGIDSLVRTKVLAKAEPQRTRSRRASFSPVVGFHRSTGTNLGLGIGAEGPSGVLLDARGSYGFANKEGRYRFDLSRTVARWGGEGGGALRMNASYARETLPFAPEHATPLTSTVSAFFSGRDRQSVYERRAGALELRWSSRALSSGIGWRSARDQSMPRATRFTVWGSALHVPEVTAARPGAHEEGFARIILVRSAVPVLGAEGQYAARNRWRARLAAARSFGILGFEGHLQAEAGSSARTGPPQDRFELGGPLAIPSLRLGDAAGNRLVLGKCELVHRIDLMRALGVPSLYFLSIHPAIFVQEGSAWTSRDARWTRPPENLWRGAAGIALVQLPGFPLPTTYVRLQMAWPVGPDSGVPRFSLTAGSWHDLMVRRPGRAAHAG